MATTMALRLSLSSFSSSVHKTTRDYSKKRRISPSWIASTRASARLRGRLFPIPWLPLSRALPHSCDGNHRKTCQYNVSQRYASGKAVVKGLPSSLGNRLEGG